MDLEDNIDRAVKAGAKPDDLLRFIDEEPLVNTFLGRKNIIAADFDSDPGYKHQFVNPHKAAFLAYWKIAEEANHVKIIGIAWNKNLVPKKFRALILHPD